MQEAVHGSSRRLLTAQQVQKMLEVDRSTIYRMAEDGRLPGIKVGRQWRFPQDRIAALLRLPEPPAPPAPPTPHAPRAGAADPAGGDAPEVTSLTAQRVAADLPAAALPVLQISAELLGVMMVLADMDGHPITGVVNPCEWFVDRADDPETIATCTAEWRSLADDPDCIPHFHTGAHGFQCARAFIRSGSTLIGMVLAGGIAPPGCQTPGLYHLDDAGRTRVLLALPKVAAVLSHVAPRAVDLSPPKE